MYYYAGARLSICISRLKREGPVKTDHLSWRTNESINYEVNDHRIFRLFTKNGAK